MRVYFPAKSIGRRSPAEAVLAKWRRVYPGIDVIVHGGAGIPCSSTPILFPGDQIARDIDTNAVESYGTLGLIVMKSGQTGRYILTNYHVFRQLLTATTQDIYKPHKTTCNKPVATVPAVSQPDQPPFPKDMVFLETYADPAYASLNFKVDAALAPINSGIKSSNVNPNISNKIAQFGPALRDLVTELSLELQTVSSDAEAKALNASIAAKNIAVMKFGATTGFTRGLVIGVCLPTLSQPPYVFQLVITPDPSEPVQTKVYSVGADEVTGLGGLVDTFSGQFVPLSVTLTPGAASGDTQKIELSGRIFCDQGDSGSIVLDTAGNIVGLLQQVWATKTNNGQSLNMGLGSAQFIGPAFDALGLARDAAVPPGAPQAGMVMAQTRPQAQVIEESLIDAAERLFGGTAAGGHLIRFARMHLEEIQRVLHHRRRGMVGSRQQVCRNLL
jgi:hypothetical protein